MDLIRDPSIQRMLLGGRGGHGGRDNCPSPLAQKIYASLIASNEVTAAAAAQAIGLANLTGNAVIVGASATGTVGLWEGLGVTGAASIGIVADSSGNIGLAVGGKGGGGFAGTGYSAGGSVTFTRSPTIFGVGASSPQFGGGGGNGVVGGAFNVSPNGTVTVTAGTGAGAFSTFGGAGGTEVIPLVCR